MALDYFLWNLAPFVPVVLLAGGLTWWLRISRWAWIAASLVLIGVVGFFLLSEWRSAGFKARGGVCLGTTRSFMEAMQSAFMADGVFIIVGCVILTVLAFRKHWIVGAVAAIPLIGSSLWSAFYLNVAAGMTAVDGYQC